MAEAPTRLPRKPKGERPRYFDDPAVDKLIGMVLSLAGEVSVLHDRLDTFERVAASRGHIAADEIDRYQPTPEVTAARDKWRETFLGEVLRVVHQDIEALDRDHREPYQAAIDIVTEGVAPVAGEGRPG